MSKKLSLLSCAFVLMAGLGFAQVTAPASAAAEPAQKQSCCCCCCCEHGHSATPSPEADSRQ